MIKIILLISIMSTQYLFALVSIAPMEIGEKEGIHGNASFGFETKRGNTNIDN